jgi:PAS domain S-box-containing protein
MFAAGIDRFVPARMHVGDADVLRRARLTVAFNAILILLAVLYAAVFCSMNSPTSAAALVTAVGVGVASLCVMRLTGSCVAAGNLLAAAFFATLTVLACRLGGHGAHALSWYAGVPLVALSTAGRRSAAGWLAVIVSSLVAFYTLHVVGWSFPNDLTPSQYDLLGLVSWTGLFSLLVSLALAYETSMERTLAELRSTEDRLRRERDFSDCAIASLPGIFYVFDDEGRFLRWNQNLEHVSGYSPEELSKIHPLDFFRGHDKDVIKQRIEDVFTKGNAATEACFVTRSGMAIPHLLSGRRLMIDGKAHVVGVGIDIAERKRAEEALRESEERFRRFAVASGYGLAMGELSGQLVFANAATLRIVEEESEEAFTKKTFYQYYTPADAERLRQEILPIVAEKGHWVGEVPLLSARGNPVATEQNIFLIRDEQGVPRMVGNIITDITERKRSEVELARARDKAEAATRAKSEFLANMSHEIRTPMTAILGFADVLAASIRDPDQLDAARTIKRNGEYLIGIINDILDLSKIEAGKLEVEQVQCSPCQILSEVASLMRVRANSKNLPLEIEYDGPIPESIQSDPKRLRQILVNLIGNAIKFTEAGEVRVVARLSGAESGEPAMQFDVIDSGIGMTAGQIGELFKPFSQLDASTTRRHGGTGLGLTISQRLARELGGDINVQSTPGQGSTFTVKVSTGPLDGVRLLASPAEAQLPANSVSKPAEPIASVDCRVLLAEDGLDNQRLIAVLLKKAGATVVVVENGKLAYDAALAARDAGTSFDVILMDMQMPVMDGYEATEKLRAAGYTGPIIALTAHAMSTDRTRCLQAGCDDYATKPIDRRQLLALVAEHTSRPGIHQRTEPPATRPHADSHQGHVAAASAISLTAVATDSALSGTPFSSNAANGNSLRS